MENKGQVEKLNTSYEDMRARVQQMEVELHHMNTSLNNLAPSNDESASSEYDSSGVSALNKDYRRFACSMSNANNTS